MFFPAAMLDCGRLTGQIGLRCSTTSGLPNVKSNRGPTYYCKCSLSTITLWEGNMWVICFFHFSVVLPYWGVKIIDTKFDPQKCSYCTSYKSLPYQCFTYWSPNVGGAPIRPATFPNSGNGAAGGWLARKTAEKIGNVCKTTAGIGVFSI